MLWGILALSMRSTMISGFAQIAGLSIEGSSRFSVRFLPFKSFLLLAKVVETSQVDLCPLTD